MTSNWTAWDAVSYVVLMVSLTVMVLAALRWWLAPFIQVLKPHKPVEDVFTRTAREDQHEASYPYCELGLKHCLSQSCGCVDTRGYRRQFVEQRAANLRRAAAGQRTQDVELNDEYERKVIPLHPPKDQS